MKQIKTIVIRDTYPEEFDQEVNDALAAGWVLVKRDVLGQYEGMSSIAHRAYYAELERETFTEDNPREWIAYEIGDCIHYICPKCEARSAYLGSEDHVPPKRCTCCGTGPLYVKFVGTADK